MEYLDFLPFVSVWLTPRLCLYGKLYVIESGNVGELGDLTSVVVSRLSS
jgi:hypothetical protein